MRQLYPILLSIAIAMAVGVYLHPKEARKCLQLASQWGREVLHDILQAASAFAEEPARVAPSAGYPTTSAYGAAGLPSAAYEATVAPASAVTYPRVLAGPGETLDSAVYTAAPPSVDDSNSALRYTSAIRGAYPQQQTGNPLRPSMPREAPWTAEQQGPTAAGADPSAAQPSAMPQYGSNYPRADWAGQWRDFENIPENVKPVNQSPWGYLPPPQVDATKAAVDQYLPAQQANSATAQPATSAAQPWVQTGAQPAATSQAPVSGTATAPAASPAQRAIPRGAGLKGRDPVADLTLCEGAQVLARVGSEVVLASDVLPKINEKLSTVKGIEDIPADRLEAQREALVRQLLQSQIDLKLIYVDAKRALPPEAIENINKQLSKRFEEVEVANRMKELKLGSRRELEAQLLQWGTSLEREKRAFIEKSTVQQWVVEMLRKEVEQINHEELLAFYHQHAADYEHPARTRWEHLEVKFSRHPDKQEAWQLIAAMGNEIIKGRPFAEVARERSEGATASSGGHRDWITQGSLKSELLDQALFTLPPGRLSRVLEDEDGFHIVRVVERQDAYRTPFEEAQTEIREKLSAERKDARLKELIKRLREEIPVWTVFGEGAEGLVGNESRKRF